MDGLLTKQRIHVDSDKDMVLLNVENLTVHIPYIESFKIAQAIRLQSKDIMRYIHEDSTKWLEMARLDEQPDRTTPYEVNAELRTTEHIQFNWRVGWEGEDVKVLFGNNLLQFHFTSALKISQWLRYAGQKAKAWSGNKGVSINLLGILSDAEKNYKLGIH